MPSSLPLGLSVPRNSNSPEGRSANAHQGMSVGGRQNGIAVRTDADDDQDSDSGPSGRAKAVLTEEQKKANHIQSEQKRREKIREQYDKLAELTPGMEGQGRSEGRVLEEAVKYAERLKDERIRLIEQVEARGGIVSPNLKKAIEPSRSK